jgi:hypothetical protein
VDQIKAAAGPGFGGLAFAGPVAVVGTTGNIAEATSSIRKVFAGNLCVVKAANTETAALAQRDAFAAAVGNDWMTPGLTMFGITELPLGTSRLIINVVVDTPELEELLSKLHGPDPLIDAWIAPV